MEDHNDTLTDSLSDFFSVVSDTVIEFFYALGQAIVDSFDRANGAPSILFSLFIMVVGGMLVLRGLRVLFQGALLGAVVRVLAGLGVMSWLMI